VGKKFLLKSLFVWTNHPMSHFTEYQVRRFRFIFNQYSEDAVTEAEIETDPFQSPENELSDPFADDNPYHLQDRRIDIDGEPANSSWKIKLSYRLTANELCALLVNSLHHVSASKRTN
jgi:hypothetical protein